MVGGSEDGVCCTFSSGNLLILGEAKHPFAQRGHLRVFLRMHGGARLLRRLSCVSLALFCDNLGEGI